jgi:hypothetical protein
MHKNENTQNLQSFLALTFFRGICLNRHQRIWNQHKIRRFSDTHIVIFQEKIFLGHNSTLCNLKMQMRKKLYIFKHFAKSKKLFFCQYLSFSVWFPLSLKHWSPLMHSHLGCRFRTEMEFFDISLKKKNFAPCYPQPLVMADFKENDNLL